MARTIFFHLSWLFFFFFSPSLRLYTNSSESGSCNLKRVKRGRSCMKKRAIFFLFVLIACQHLCADREAGRRRSLWGEHFSSAFQKICWLASSCVGPQARGAGRAHSSLWLQLMKHSCASVFPAPGACTRLRSKPQQCAAASSALPKPSAGLGPERCKQNSSVSLALSLNAVRINVCCCRVFPVIRAKLVGRQEVDVGNDIYGNPIKRIKYDIKQIKVCVTEILFSMQLYKLKSSMNMNVLFFLFEPSDVQGSQPGFRIHLHRSLLRGVWSDSGD